MFFILSKTINFLFMPLMVVCLCFLFSVLLKKQNLKKRFFWSGFILLFFFSNDFIANEVMGAWEIKTKPYHDMKTYSLGIVLTGATIPELLPNDRVYFNHAADRVVHTVQLFKLGIIRKVLVSGGSGRLVNIGEREAQKFKEAMILMGIPNDSILIEDKTRNTHESALEVKKIITKMGYKQENSLLITSAFHMRRSLACYRKVGMAVDNFTTDFYSHPRKYYFDTLFIPKIEAFVIWHILVREWLGMIAYKLAGYI